MYLRTLYTLEKQIKEEPVIRKKLSIMSVCFNSQGGILLVSSSSWFLVSFTCFAEHLTSQENRTASNNLCATVPMFFYN